MAKNEIGRNGKLTPRSKAKNFERTEYAKLDIELREQASPQLGPRTQVLHAYEEKKSREDAYRIANEINEKIGQKVYSKETVDQWIEEYEKRKEEMERDGDAR